MEGVITYLDHFKAGERFMIVMEYLGEEWSDLYDFIEARGPVEEFAGRKIFMSIVEVVVRMYDLGFSHNDIKGTEILA